MKKKIKRVLIYITQYCCSFSIGIDPNTATTKPGKFTQQFQDMRKFSVISRNSVHFFKIHILVYEQPLGLGTAIVQSSLLPELQHIHWHQRMADR